MKQEISVSDLSLFIHYKHEEARYLMAQSIYLRLKWSVVLVLNANLVEAICTFIGNSGYVISFFCCFSARPAYHMTITFRSLEVHLLSTGMGKR